MELGTINWLAVLVAGVSSFVVGGIWYSPGLFGKAWMKDNNFTEEGIKLLHISPEYCFYEKLKEKKTA